MSKEYKWCLVSSCRNTSVKTPSKEFIQVPSNRTVRLLWLATVGRDPHQISRNVLYICEDHFDLPNDMENYMEWKVMGCRKKMKKDVIPHRNISVSSPSVCMDVCADLNTAAMSQNIVCTVESIEEEMVPKKVARYDEDTCSSEVTSPSTLVCNKFPRPPEPDPQFASSQRHVGILAKPQYRSKGIQVVPHYADKSNSPLKSQSKEQSTSPAKCSKIILHMSPAKPIKLNFLSDLPETTSQSSPSSSQGVSEEVQLASDSDNFMDAESSSALALKSTISKINLHPKTYLGIAKELMWIVKDIEEQTGIKEISIYITLMKIKTARIFAHLADDFGISETSISRIFRESVVLMGPLLQRLIVWPPSESIKTQLPMQFRARFGGVESIIDCFEIEIHKPLNPVKQALTWSEYKKANTLKYLISSTPDGIINFVSRGFGGRTTDQCIVENSGYLDVLKPGVVVMADRGFKNIDKLLLEKQCILVRPPSVPSGTKLSKEDVMATKRIASLRIHIERVIRRLREFSFLIPHSCLHS